MVRKLAYQDALTELPNRRAFADKLEQLLNDSEKDNSPFAVMFIDLDGFKNVNDSLGHKAGDDLLRNVGKSLKKCVRENDMVTESPAMNLRFSYLALNSWIVFRSPGRIIESLNLSFCFPEKEIRVSARYRNFLISGQWQRFLTLLKHADMAMYHAKNNGKNRYQFTELVTAN